MNKYEVKIVNALLKKYYNRKSVYKDANINRRIDLPVNKILKNYSNFNVNIDEKDLVNQAIESLEKNNYITSAKLKLSDDYEKVYLRIDNISLLEEYAANELDITPRSFAVDELQSIINKYRNNGLIVDYYIDELENVIQNRSIQLNTHKEEDILKVLSFLENNKEFLYLREASMLIFGDSKYLENNRRAQVNSVLYNYLVSIDEDVFEDENLFERFNVYDTDQDICIKGPMTIELSNKSIDINGLSGGVSFSIKDIHKIQKIVANCDKVITVENKTSFLRMNDGNCYIYLGGFATKPQITFIKKLISDNHEKEYFHFGDIDAGGFWIHQKLCDQVGIDFKLFHMTRSDLEDKKYEKCLKKLSDSDIKRLTNLKIHNEYSECINYMLNANVKLEQEIISFYISRNK